MAIELGALVCLRINLNTEMLKSLGSPLLVVVHLLK